MTNVEFHLGVEPATTPALRESLNPLPRSVVRSNAFLLLDGAWRFELDPENRGLRERWHLGHEYAAGAQWPALSRGDGGGT